MLHVPKRNLIMDGLALLVLGALALAFTLGLALLPPEAPGYTVRSGPLASYRVRLPSASPAVAQALLWICLPLPAIGIIECGWWSLSEGLKKRQQRLWRPAGTFRSSLAAYRWTARLLTSFLFIPLCLLVLGACLYELPRFPVTLSWHTGAYAATSLAYLALRRRLARALASALRGLSRPVRGFPRCTLTGDGVTIELMPRGRGAYIRPVRFRFDEIEELRALTSSEAQPLRYGIGHDFGPSGRHMGEPGRYLKGGMPRPAVSTIRTTLFVKGPGLRYLVELDAGDADRLIEAYRSYKASRDSTHWET